MGPCQKRRFAFSQFPFSVAKQKATIACKGINRHYPLPHHGIRGLNAVRLFVTACFVAFIRMMPDRRQNPCRPDDFIPFRTIRFYRRSCSMAPNGPDAYADRPACRSAPWIRCRRSSVSQYWGSAAPFTIMGRGNLRFGSV